MTTPADKLREDVAALLEWKRATSEWMKQTGLDGTSERIDVDGRLKKLELWRSGILGGLAVLVFVIGIFAGAFATKAHALLAAIFS